MHKIFGKKEAVSYTDREGAYLIPIKNGRVAVIETPKGYFLLGGGVDTGESHEACIKRECLEETGCEARVGNWIASAETYTTHPVIGYFHPIQAYYAGELSERVQDPVERDHRLVWIEAADAAGKMFSPMQAWAVALALSEDVQALDRTTKAKPAR